MSCFLACSSPLGNLLHWCRFPSICFPNGHISI
uniref:Uncharacterized protein n=1 Tax=Arundo donax TaxID=35708 RepID=A0A0A8YBP9_ARUDO